MTMLLELIPMDRIDWSDRTFAVPSFFRPEALEASLAQTGMICPPWVLQKSCSFAIVDGFKRLAWAKESAAFRNVVCLVFPQDADREALLLSRIEQKLFGPAMNVAEKAAVLALLAGLFSIADIPARFLALLRIASHRETLEKWVRLAGQRPEFLETAVRGEISERVALDVSGWEEETRVPFLYLLAELRCSDSIQAELAERVSEIALREGKRRLDVVLDPAIEAVRAEKGLNHRQKTQMVRDLLYKLRFPRLNARQEAVRIALDSQGPPKSVGLVPPASFEGTEWKLLLTFSSGGELDGLLDEARAFCSSERLENILRAARPTLAEGQGEAGKSESRRGRRSHEEQE